MYYVKIHSEKNELGNAESMKTPAGTGAFWIHLHSQNSFTKYILLISLIKDFTNPHYNLRIYYLRKIQK